MTEVDTEISRDISEDKKSRRARRVFSNAKYRTIHEQRKEDSKNKTAAKTAKDNEKEAKVAGDKVRAEAKKGSVYESSGNGKSTSVEDSSNEKPQRVIVTEFEEKAEQQLRNLLGEHADKVINALGAQTEELVKIYGRGIIEIVDSLGDQTVDVIDSIRAQTEQLSEEIGNVDESIREETRRLLGAIKSVNIAINDQSKWLKEKFEGSEEALEALAEEDPELRATLANVNKAIGSLAWSQERQNQLMEENTPSNLRIPTPERMRGLTRLREGTDVDSLSFEQLVQFSGKVGEKAEELLAEAKERGFNANNVKKNLENDMRNFLKPTTRQDPRTGYEGSPDINSQLYQKVVKDWFEEQIRYMEAGEESFEENRDVYSRVALAVTYFQFRPETQSIGDDIYKDLEYRRLHKRHARNFGISPPKNLISTASTYQKDVVQHMFTRKVEDNLMGFVGNNETNKLKDPIAVNAEEFGKVIELADDKSVGRNENEKKEIRDKKVKNYILRGGNLEEDEARQLGLGNMFVDEAIKHLKKIESDDPQTYKEKGFAKLRRDLEMKLSARRTAGELANVTFELAKRDIVIGTSGFFSARVMNFADRLRNRELYRGMSGVYDSPHHGEFSLGMPTFFEGVIKEKDGKGVKRRHFVKTGNKKDFIGNKEFWDEGVLADMNPAYYPADTIDKFEKADEDRSAHWGMDTPLQNPSATGYVQFVKRGGFNQYSDSKVEGISKKDSYGDQEASAREVRIAEDLDRRLHWMRTKQAISKIEGLQYYPSAQKKGWIDAFAADELISNKQRDYFYRKHLNVLGLGYIMDPEKVANFRVDWGTTLGNVREHKGDITLEALKEYLKKALGYIFSD
jgi:hypothetical protein